jgi:hypothetical protein
METRYKVQRVRKGSWFMSRAKGQDSEASLLANVESEHEVEKNKSESEGE